MRAWGNGSKTILLGAGWVASLFFTAQMAIASPSSSKNAAKHASAKHAASGQAHAGRPAGGGRLASSHSAGRDHYTLHAGRAVFPGGNATRHALHGRGGYHFASYRFSHGYHGPTLQCVAFARADSNVSLSGNAADWWSNAAGVYARGNRPQPGSVLAFTANARMRLGHVAVVSQVINAREIEVDHANWGGYHGAVARGVPVVDVSPNNDWTAVRVGLSRSGDFGSVYPTHGFIYDRPDNGVRVASVSHPAPELALNPAPADLRSGYGRQSFKLQGDSYDEVAEAPADGRAFDRPNRSLR